MKRRMKKKKPMKTWIETQKKRKKNQMRWAAKKPAKMR
jgi:hypothetical protein